MDEIIIHKDYNEILKNLLVLIRTNKAKAISSVNTILLKTYWEIWKEIEEKKDILWWWTKILEKLSSDLQEEFPWEKGFSVANLKNMSLFYREFPEIGEPLAHQLSWTSHMLIIKECKSIEERKFYRIFTEKENWSKRELKRQIETDLCYRVIWERDESKIISYLDTLKSPSKSLSNYFRDEYVLDFIDEEKILLEKDLENAILDNLWKFFLEWWKWEISLVGQQYPCLIDWEEHKIDLLLYHRDLQCLVVLELKTTKFKAEYVWQVNKYLSYLNKYKKKSFENHPIWLILCKEATKETVEFALDWLEEKMKVAVYKSLPSQSVLQEQIKKIEEKLKR